MVTVIIASTLPPIQGGADNPKINAIVVIRGSVDGKYYDKSNWL